MDLGIAGRKAIVCASSRGLGRACAYHLADAGCEVVVNGRDKATTEATAAEIAKATGATVTAVVADVSTKDGQAALFAIKGGMQKLAAGDVPGAVLQLQEAVRLAPENPQAHYQLAAALLRAGSRDEARQHMDEVRRLAPALVPPDAK